MSGSNGISRRRVFQRAAALTGGIFVEGLARSSGALAQKGTITVASLTPLTGSGGTYGPSMRDMAAAVVRQCNEAGGISGRQVRFVSEDDQTNPEAAVRAARKLIDVDRACAIVGTWASSVTSAVAPLCWENRTFLTTVSGADSITRLPHQGYIIRTQPNSDVQGAKFGELALEIGARKIAYLGPQTPFAQPTIAGIQRTIQSNGGEVTSVIYDGGKSSLRSEVDEGLRGRPDTIVMGGFTPDTTTLIKDLFRAGFKGKLVAFGFAVTPKLLGDLPSEAVEGVYVVQPAPAYGSEGYRKASALLGRPDLDTYAAQVFDQMNLVLLALAVSQGSTGTDVRDAVRRVSQGQGPVVADAVSGLQALAAGATALNYEGATGSCTFDAIGDVTDARFRFDQVKGGKLSPIKFA